ncbi:MAG: hypothetical protein K2Q97_09775, partial [Burkholderiaceae bacterium]|nr:hypothetical protein [Burkholderiaceae bacterium]
PLPQAARDIVIAATPAKRFKSGGFIFIRVSVEQRYCWFSLRTIATATYQMPFKKQAHRICVQ